MADKKISALTAATTPLVGTEVLPIVQGGATVKVSVDNLTAGKPVSMSNITYTGILTGGTGVINIGSGQFYKDASGNVGIGTASPTNKLSVVGGRTNFTANNETFSLGVQYGTGAGLYYIGATNAATPDLVFSQVGGVENMRLTNGGTLGLGTAAPNASAILDAQSTTKGVRMPNMTTTQKNAIVSPPAGLMVFDITLSKLCVYSGAAWQTITSV
jgi:hypothetical protein